MELAVVITAVIALALVRYSFLPLPTTLAAAVGALQLPGAMSWIGSPPALAAAAGLFGLAIFSDSRHRPPLLRGLERGVGLPFAAAALSAVGLSSGMSAGLEGQLLSPEGSAGDVFRTTTYAGTDTATLSLVAIVSAPLMYVGKVIRSLTRWMPYSNTAHAAGATVAVAASTLVMQLPTEARIAMAFVSIVAIALLGFGIVRRIHEIATWWSLEDAPTRQRLAVAAEPVLPGGGMLLLGRTWSGVPRLALAVLTLASMVILGPLALALYAWLGLGGAVQVTRTYVGPRRHSQVIDDSWTDRWDDPEDPDDDDWPRPWHDGPDEPSGLAAAAMDFAPRRKPW